MPAEGSLLIFVGPSAAGKTTLARALNASGIVDLLPTVTTRPRRPDETFDADHRFVSDAEFDRLAARGEFIASGAHSGLPYRYGLMAIDADCRLPAVILRARHVVRVASAAGRLPLVYQIVTSEELATARLLARGCDPDEVRARHRLYAEEIRAGERVRQRVFVNDRSIAELVDEVARGLEQHLAEGANS
jgi:guanylate kinase